MSPFIWIVQKLRHAEIADTASQSVGVGQVSPAGNVDVLCLFC